MLTITFLGNSCFEIASSNARIVVDPYLTGNDDTTFGVDRYLSDGVELDAVCVTHLAHDHFGDCAELAAELSVPVITEPATGYVLNERGIPDDQVVTLVWGQTAALADLTIRALEAHHVSTTTVTGQLVTGVPLSFLFRSGGRSVYHLGDTSIFSDLELFGRLYEPDVALIGVGQAREPNPGLVSKNIAELSIEEAALAAEWLNSELVVPMHCLPAEKDRFMETMKANPDLPRATSMEPGDDLSV